MPKTDRSDLNKRVYTSQELLKRLCCSGVCTRAFACESARKKNREEKMEGGMKCVCEFACFSMEG